MAKKATKEDTKENTKSGRGRTVILQEGPGAGMRRVDYIRQEFQKGRSRSEIAKELGVPYQIVFAATKAKKTEKNAA